MQSAAATLSAADVVLVLADGAMLGMETLAVRPRAGLCLRARYVRCRDGDTVEVSVAHSARIWAIRLIDCWCAEKNTPAGVAAREYAESVLQDVEDLHVFIPFDELGPNLLRGLVSFDRILGEVWVDQTKTLNEMMVSAGHATAKKDESRC